MRLGVTDFREWLAQDAAAKERLARIQAAFPQPYERGRPRGRDEARLLRERGTPERLIGRALLTDGYR
jgi:hypothetical protein